MTKIASNNNNKEFLRQTAVEILREDESFINELTAIAGADKIVKIYKDLEQRVIKIADACKVKDREKALKKIADKIKNLKQETINKFKNEKY